MPIRFLVLLTAVGFVLALRPTNACAQAEVSDSYTQLEEGEFVYDEGYESSQPADGCGDTCDPCDRCDAHNRCGQCAGASGYYFDVRAGGMSQQRSTFHLGKITEDSNDVPAGQHVTYAEPGFEIGGDGPNFELVAGTYLNCCWNIEARFAYASLDEDGTFELDDLSNVPFQTGAGGFWVPFIDASTPEHARGIFGMRIRNNIDVDYEYDSDWFDFGMDFVHHLAADHCGRLDLIVGPSFANIDQHLHHETTGDWNGPEQTSDVREELERL